MPPTDRGRAGKFSKPRRGGGKHFSKNLEPLDSDGNPISMWGIDANKKKAAESSEEESSEEESSEESSEDENAETLTREQRRAAAKAKKEAAIKKKSQKVPEVGDLPSDSEEESDFMPANPNHTAASRSQASTVPTPASADQQTSSSGGKKSGDTANLSRREREALQAQQAKERYQKLHAEGKTDEARADLERLTIVKQRREAEAARKKAEGEEKAEQEKKRLDEMTDKERKKRDLAMGPAAGAGGKGKAGKK